MWEKLPLPTPGELGDTKEGLGLRGNAFLCGHWRGDALAYLSGGVQYATECKGLRLQGELEQEMEFGESSTCRWWLNLRV